MSFVKMICRALALALVSASFSAAAPAAAQEAVGLDRGPQPPHLLKDLPAASYRLELLDLAWRAATSYPLDPHIKNRARAEEEVVLGALGIDQPHLAWGYAKQVVNWRRGACYAEIAHYLLERGETEHVEYFLQQALRHSKDPLQGWRHERVKARVAQARVLMGDAEKAQAMVDPEDAQGQGARLSAEASVADPADFDRLVSAFDAMAATGGYEELLAAMSGYAGLYGRYYDDEPRRTRMLQKTRSAWEKMPGIRRFEVLMRFADAALAHGDVAEAAARVDELDAVRNAFAWSIDYDLRLRSDVARYRLRLGQTDQACAMLDEAAGLAEGDGLESLQNFDRAGALRPVAEVYADLGDTDRAHALYARVVALGAVNPNMRPRVSDITATCVSMALHGVEPDAELLGEVRQIVSGLVDR